MKLIPLLGLVLTINAYAHSESYTMFCGSFAELKELAKADGQVLTKADLKELNESRSSILQILAKGKPAIKRLLEEGSKADTGAFGALLTCGMINEIKTEILEDGCIDLISNKVIEDNGGIKACEEVLRKLQK